MPAWNDTTLTKRTTASSGFTLIELTIVVLILGVLAAIAVPKIFNSFDTAADNGLRQTLNAVRDAIDLYAAKNGGTLPGATLETQASFKAELKPYLRRQFPKGPFGPAKGDNRVMVLDDGGDPLTGQPSPTRAWKYDLGTGEFIFNFNGISSDGVTNYDEF
jgi:general secretion pathway protein G